MKKLNVANGNRTCDLPACASINCATACMKWLLATAPQFARNVLADMEDEVLPCNCVEQTSRRSSSFTNHHEKCTE
jgi:hypothetical protein